MAGRLGEREEGLTVLQEAQDGLLVNDGLLWEFTTALHSVWDTGDRRVLLASPNSNTSRRSMCVCVPLPSLAASVLLWEALAERVPAD